MKTGTILAFWSASAVAVSAASAQSINPHGLYFHTFTGSTSGSEWSTWGPLGAPNRHEFADLRSSGAYPATFAPNNSFTLDGGVGAGAFSDADHAHINFNFGGGTVFNSNMVRAPYTDDQFPVFLTSTVTGDAALSGQWFAQIRDVNPATGATSAVLGTNVDVLVSGTTVRIDLPGGTFYQGVWMSESQAGFRVIDRIAPNPAYRTFPGSATNLNLNMVGDLRLTSPDSMTLAVFFETRAGLGNQVQTMKYLELSKVPTPGTTGALLISVGIAATRRRRS